MTFGAGRLGNVREISEIKPVSPMPPLVAENKSGLCSASARTVSPFASVTSIQLTALAMEPLLWALVPNISEATAAPNV
ncbi:unknown [Acetobacter sp. CAG:977]|nr:unknown [Acetobacter sp. CAG:977]